MSESLTLFDVALTANRIMQKCVLGVAHSKGGTSMIGDMSKGFFVNVEGYPGSGGVGVNVTGV